MVPDFVSFCGLISEVKAFHIWIYIYTHTYLYNFCSFMNCPFVSVHLFFPLNCMNASLHRACCLLQVQAHTTALGGAKVTGWSWVMLPSLVAARAGCAVDCFAIQLVTKWSPLSVGSALQKPGLASDVCVTDFICPFVSVIIRKVQKLPVIRGLWAPSASAALGGLKCCNHSMWFALHWSKLPTACVTP